MGGMSERPPIEPVPHGTRWPSGWGESIATLKVDDAWVASQTSAPLLSGDSDGLGTWVGIGGKLPSGACVEIIRYQYGQPDFVLNTDSSANLRDTLEEFLRVTGLQMDAVQWRHSSTVDPPNS